MTGWLSLNSWLGQMGVRSNVKDAKILIAFSLLAHRQGYWVKWPLEPVWGIFCPNSKIKNLLFFPFFLIIEFGQIKQKIENVQCSPASTNMIVSYTLGQKKNSKSKIHILPTYLWTNESKNGYSLSPWVCILHNISWRY